MREDVDLLLHARRRRRRAQIDDVVLLGMGGSSLAPEVLRQSFGGERFHVLDTTHPRRSATLAGAARPRAHAVRRRVEVGLDARDALAHRLLLEARAARRAVGRDHRSRAPSWRRSRASASSAPIFPGEPTIGGRYSALSPFGLVPAALLGVDLARLLDRALRDGRGLPPRRGQPGPRARPRARRGLARRAATRSASPNAGRLRPLGRAAARRVDRQAGQGPRAGARRVAPTGPTGRRTRFGSPSPYELGQEFFRWEFATAVAGSILGINPFDQPDVQAAKDRTNEVLAARRRRARRRGLGRRAARARRSEGDYVCIQAFVDPTPAAEARIARARRRAPATRPAASSRTASGPRYLHSTGQLHKGGPNTGLFLQVVEDYGDELKIPGQPFGFARLIRAQAAGDFESLRERGRRVARVHMERSSRCSSG